MRIAVGKVTIQRLLLSIAFAAYVAALTPASAWAVPISFDEAISGDLPDFNPAEFSLGVGENSFAGTASVFVDRRVGFNIDADNFLFNLASGQSLVDVRIEVTDIANSSASGVHTVDSSFALDTPFGVQVALAPAINLLTAAIPTTASIPGSVLPLGPGQFLARIGHGFGAFGPGPVDVSFDYRITLSVEATSIPEPSAVLLFGLGLAGLGLAMRRRRLGDRCR